MRRNKELQSTQLAGNNSYRTALLYQKVADHIRRCFTHGILVNRVILKEYSIGRILNISLTPARKALAQLDQEKLIHRRNTHRYVVGSRAEGPLLKLTPEMVQLSSEEVPLGSNDPFIEEHIDILEAIDRQNMGESRLRFQAHLIKSRQKVIDSLRACPRMGISESTLTCLKLRFFGKISAAI